MIVDETALLSHHLSAVASAQTQLSQEIKTQKAVVEKAILAAGISDDEAVNASLIVIMQGFEATADEEVATAEARVRALLDLTNELLRSLDGEEGGVDDGFDGGGGLTSEYDSSANTKASTRFGSGGMEKDDDEHCSDEGRAAYQRKKVKTGTANRWDSYGDTEDSYGGEVTVDKASFMEISDLNYDL